MSITNNTVSRRVKIFTLVFLPRSRKLDCMTQNEYVTYGLSSDRILEDFPKKAENFLRYLNTGDIKHILTKIMI
jgi:hypothetical protein